MSWTDPAPGAQWGRTDQGVDWGGVRQGLVAVARGVIVNVYNNLSGFGQTIIERVGNQYIYYAEETSGVTTTAYKNEQVSQGEQIASGGSGGGIEVGFWNPATGRALGAPQFTGANPTPAGQQFRSMLGSGQVTLSQLWINAGGSPQLANTMAAIAMAESGGNPNAQNPSGASGLWQILMPANAGYVHGNVFDPFVNAQAAVAIEKAQGLNAWTTYTSGAYRQFLGSASRFEVNYGGPNGGRVRPGGTTDTGQQITNLFQQYNALLDTPRTAPPTQYPTMTSAVSWYYNGLLNRLQSFYASRGASTAADVSAGTVPPSTTPGSIGTQPGVQVPGLGGIGRRNIP